MKFWQKVVLGSVIIFVLGMDIVAFVLLSKSYALVKENELAAALNEEHFIKSSLIESISATDDLYSQRNAVNLKPNILPYADYYAPQHTYMELYLNDELIYSNFTPAADSRPELQISSGEQSSLVKNVGSTKYLFRASFMNEPYSRLKFVYIKDIQTLADYKQEMTRYFVFISMIAAVVLTLLVTLLVWRLTHPLRELNKATSDIAAGNYTKRVHIGSQDEIGEFARSFNIMAGSVEAQVELLSGLTAEKQRFIDNLAHEMRTPITAIMGYGEFLKVANHSEEDRIKALDYMISQSERMKNMSTKLLDLAGLRSGHFHFEAVRLDSIVHRVEATLAHSLSEKQVSFTKNIELATLWTDADLLESLLTNLLENSLRAVSPGGSIELKAYARREQYLLSIADNGKGLAVEELARVTEPFYRVDGSRARSDGGAGLGLALCEGICRVHQAEMKLTSAPNAGTTVEITFYNSVRTS